MKRSIAVLFVMVQVMSLSACGNNDRSGSAVQSKVSHIESIESTKTEEPSEKNSKDTSKDTSTEISADISAIQESTEEVSEETDVSRSVTIDVSCKENLAFSKYDVKVILDENELGTIEHGKEKPFDVKLNNGSHTIRFTNDENDSVSGSYEIDISSDTTVVFSIECKRDKINVTLISQNERPGAHQVATPLSFYDFKSKQLDEAESLLKEAGFKNIRTERLEDLITGLLTKENEVESVTINGSDDFKKGSVFDENTQVVIVYHTFPEEKSEDTSKVDEKSKADEKSTVEESSDSGIASEYELAFVKKGPEYSIYYMFDTDNNSCVYFSTNDTSLMLANYSGDFASGIDINWEAYEESWHEKFVYTGGTKGTLYDYYGTDWDYSKCTVEEAQKELNKIKKGNF